MITSMTGFGKSSYSQNGYEAQVEIRTVNHRFLDISIRLPKNFETREGVLRELIKKFISRGRVNLSVTLKGDQGFQLEIKVNEEAVRAYRELLESLRQHAGIKSPVQIEHLMGFSDIFIQDNQESVSDDAWQCIEKAVELALVDLNTMRQREGREIEADLRKRIAMLEKYIKEIERLSVGRSEKEFALLKKRIENLVDSGEVDPARLELEIALLADRVDVTEECIRFKSHNTLFLESLEQPEPAGRKLNFLLQEMNREANTIGAKANNADIAHLVVKIKEEVEKLREQVQNIE
ncbi:MAG: YicC/YloC family endoribonuclease [candidate division KSB1 bacterium]|nr:YicC/YloC family endoribonuclease [candidate division KSB1 bacterium]MDQ7063108.1 YicC/YloC family endoribonuclease [candidate division KSB1 bacterium]